MNFDFGSSLTAFLCEASSLFNIRGYVSDDGLIHPLETDSKVLAALFELATKKRLRELARKHGYKLETPLEQNYYPDFTLTRESDDGAVLFRAAVDVKTTYVEAPHDAFKYTLGSYTGCIHPSRSTKNCHYPYETYQEHWVVGFVYERVVRACADHSLYALAELGGVPLPLKNVRHFVQEKWRIAGDKPGSGNTSNIGSIEGSLAAFERGQGVFVSDAEFLAYWRHYGDKTYRNVAEFRAWLLSQPEGFVSAQVLAGAQRLTRQLGLF
jgi:hypothetical protein